MFNYLLLQAQLCAGQGNFITHIGINLNKPLLGLSGSYFTHRLPQVGDIRPILHSVLYPVYRPVASRSLLMPICATILIIAKTNKRLFILIFLLAILKIFLQ